MRVHSRDMVRKKARMKGSTTGVRRAETREARSRDRPCWRLGLSCIHRPRSLLLAFAGWVAKCLGEVFKAKAQEARTVE